MQNILSFSLLSKNIKVKIQKTVIFPFVLYGCETWSSTVSDEHRTSVFGNRVLRKVFGPMMDSVMGSGEEDIHVMRHFMTCTHQIFGSSNQEQ